MSKDIERLKEEKFEAEARASLAKDHSQYWRDKHHSIVRQAKGGRASFKSTIWRLVADRAALRQQVQSLIAFWDENVQYLDGYYLPAVRRDYKALKASIRK